jgi:CheY-like chemotaxis protein
VCVLPVVALSCVAKKNPLSILVVEDDDDVLDAIREVLEEEGYRVTAASSGAEALSILKREPLPAAMVVDFMMARMNGADLLKECAAEPALAEIPSVVISAGRASDLRAEGIHSFLAKPFRPEQLLSALAEALSDQQRSMSG